MSQIEQLYRMRLEILNSSTDASKDEVFKEMLKDAKVVALNTLFPYNKEKTELPNNIRYMDWQVRCAIELYNKIGSSNVQAYSENGLSVTFLTGLISKQLINELGPSKAGAIR